MDHFTQSGIESQNDKFQIFLFKNIGVSKRSKVCNKMVNTEKKYTLIPCFCLFFAHQFTGFETSEQDLLKVCEYVAYFLVNE